MADGVLGHRAHGARDDVVDADRGRGLARQNNLAGGNADPDRGAERRVEQRDQQHRTAGLDPAKLVQVIASSSGNSSIFKAFSERALSGKFSPPSFALNLAHKDLHLAMELADELDVPLPLGSATHNLQRMARKMGMGGDDSSAILHVYEKTLGKTVKP